ncbi:MAG: ZIP family metal transporter [Elusimicrobia bacterium]|nr:ZIP family metal transporter [Elusimicrobiota bacterium]
MRTIALWSLAAFGFTLAGSFLLLLRQDWTKSQLWRILAFASGVLLGVSFLRILPEASQISPHLAGMGVLTAFLLIFALEGFTMMHSCMEYAQDCEVHMVGWIAFGSLALHALLDGVAITIAFQKNGVMGNAVSSAILIHKLTDGLTLSGLLLGARYSKEKCLKTVLLLALATPIGAFLAFPLSSIFSNSSLGWWLGFIAGTFFYVGAADILPRLHKVKDIYCLGSFALGLLAGGFHLE